jgi:hypothetical protein
VGEGKGGSGTARLATWREGLGSRHQPKAGRGGRRPVVAEQGRVGSLTGGPRSYNAGERSETRFEPTSNWNSNEIKFDSNRSNFDWPKRYLTELHKFEIKYGCYGIEERNNFIHRNFFRFEMNVEL